MSQGLAFVFNTVLILIEDFMFLLLITGLFTPKHRGLVTGAWFFTLSFLSCVLLYFFGDSGILKIALSLGLYTGWAMGAYKTSWKKAVFTVLFWIAYVTIGDICLMALLTAATRQGMTELMRDAGTYYLFCFCIKTAELLGIVILRAWLHSHVVNETLTLADLLRVIVFPAAMLAVSLFLIRFYIRVPELAAELAICNAILLAADFASAFLALYLEHQQKLSHDNVILRENMKRQIDNVETWRAAFDNQRRQTHDFQNHLLVLHGLIEQKGLQGEALQYIEKLQKTDSNSMLPFRTNRMIVDILLNQKLAIAESRKILFLSQLDDLSRFPLTDDNLITVLSNLIDNALEACEKIKDPERRVIDLKMRMESSASYLYIENTTAFPVLIRNNRILTSKEESTEHGYGLQNVYAVLDQADAIYLVEYVPEKQSFIFSAQIPLPMQEV